MKSRVSALLLVASTACSAMGEPAAPEPQIESVLPSVVVPGETQTFTLTGSGFGEGFTAAWLDVDGRATDIRQRQYDGPDRVLVRASIAAEPGSPTVIRITNADGQSASVAIEVQREKGPPPRIASVSPAVIPSIGTYTFTLTGSGFQPGFHAWLIDEVRRIYPLEDTRFVSSSTIEITVFFGSGPASTQQLRISNPDGQMAERTFTTEGR